MKYILYTLFFIFPLLGGAQVNQQDSIALRIVWEALDGPNWSSPWNGEARSWTGTRWNEQGRLESLNLQGFQTNGNIDPAIGELTELIFLNFGRVDLIGTLPSSMNNLTKLETLKINTKNKGGGEFKEPLTDLGSLTQMKILHLYGLRLQQESWPLWLEKMTQLEWLGLSSIYIREPIPAWLNQLEQLEAIELSKMQSTGPIPDLSALNLSRFFINGMSREDRPFPTWICDINSMKYLTLIDCSLTGEVPTSISALDQLERLSLTANKLTGNINKWMKELSPFLSSLDIGRNKFTGALKESYFNSSAIGNIIVNNNRINMLDEFDEFAGAYFRVDNNQIPTQYLEPIYEQHNGVVNTLILDNQSYLLEDTVRLVEGSQYVIESGCLGQHDNYIWYKDGGVIEDAIDTHYTIESFSPSDAGVYWCEIRNDSLGNAFRTTDITILPEIITVIDPDYHIRVSAKLYPNPSRDITNIESDQQINKIRCLTARGDMIYEKTLHNALKRFKLNTSHFQPGLIYVQIFTPHDVHTLRLIKS